LVGVRLGLLRLKALRVLYEQAEDGRVYGWSKLVELLVRNGISEGYARQLIYDFNVLGVLERLKVGLYKVNKARLKSYMDRYEVMLKAYVDLYESTVESLKAARGGGE
jgi:hypothetical protein